MRKRPPTRTSSSATDNRLAGPGAPPLLHRLRVGPRPPDFLRRDRVGANEVEEGFSPRLLVPCLQLLLLIKVTGERIELLGPELLVARHPRGGGLHRRGVELAAHHPPSLLRAIRPASSSTRRCFMKPGSDMPCGAASSLHRQAAAGERVQHARAASDRRARRTRVSSSSSAYLTIGFSIYRPGRPCQEPYTFRA